MSIPSIVKGQYFDVVVDATNLGVADLTGWVVLCGLTSRSFTEAYQTNKEYLRDCGDPTMVPFGVINITGQDFTIGGTGVHNRAQGGLVRKLAGESLPYRFIEGEQSDDAVDLGYYEGNFVLTTRQHTAADGTNVTAQFTWESDGLVQHHSGASGAALASLTIAPLTATADTEWTGTITGKTSAIADDGTPLTVTGSTITGTVPDAGSVIVTVTEELPGAPNTPKFANYTVVVS
jgi:hypothetical protein